MIPGLRGSVPASVLRHLGAASVRVQRSFARISSGLRIASAADDPAGLGVSERMRARLASQRMAARNVADGIGLVRTSEGGLAQVSSLLLRLRELGVSAANGTNTPGDVASYRGEWGELVEEIARIGRGTRFGELAVLASNGSLNLQVGPQAGEVLAVQLTDLGPLARRLRAGDMNQAAWRARALTLASRAVDWVSERRAALGSLERRLAGVGRSLEEAGVRLAAAESRVRDADLATELAELTAARLVAAGGAALLAQAGREGELVLELLAAVPPPSPPPEPGPGSGAARPGSEDEARWPAAAPPARGGPGAPGRPPATPFSPGKGPLSSGRYG